MSARRFLGLLVFLMKLVATPLVVIISVLMAIADGYLDNSWHSFKRELGGIKEFWSL